ncbi:5-oxoprolinase subunit C family protein [Winogradskyella aurantiaca]|uniref:5-oxoprolinase subunit C family protein n=1 Tax=Winogradskyella aurantiaca TaxID=2219558 RepID=UPI000E1D9CC2|nr:biotin-dependent carboxyltransferase family protein [Winogradskyella aurantiaca]
MIEVINPGIYSSIQDNGRFGFRHLGVPVSGFMDAFSAELANKLVGKESGSALIEAAFTGLHLKFHQDYQLALCGAQVEAYLNGNKLSINQMIAVSEGDELVITKIEEGVWSYLGIQARVLTEQVLGSQSQYSSITKTAKLKAGDVIQTELLPLSSSSNSRLRITNFSDTLNRIEVQAGPEFKSLPKGLQANLSKIEFSIDHQSNRMAYILEHPLWPHDHTIVTAPIIPGMIQWTPEGRFICLMRDGQSTGGYPRVLYIPKEELNKLCQIQPGKHFRLALNL